MDKQYGDMKRLQEILLLQPSVEHFEQLLSTLFSWVGTESIEEVVARAEEVLSSWPDECREAELFSMHQRLAGFMFDEDALCALSLVRSVRVPLMSFIKTEDLTKVLSVLESCELLSFVVERAVFGEELEHVRQLAETQMPALKTLSLPESSLSREGVELLIQSDCFPNVQYLDLSQNQMDHNALVAFADSLSFVELHHLDLSGDVSAPNDFQKGGMAEFAERLSFQCLQSLNMSYCLLGKGGSEAFAKSTVFSSLETLTLRGCQLGREDVEVLACYGHFPLLKTLDLSENKLDDAAIEALSKAPWMRTVETLRLGWNEVGEEGAFALSQSPNLGQLKLLDLRGVELGGGALKAFAESSSLQSLRRIQCERVHELKYEDAVVFGRSVLFERMIRYSVDVHTKGEFSADDVEGEWLVGDRERLSRAICDAIERQSYAWKMGKSLAIAFAHATFLESCTVLSLDKSNQPFGNEGILALLQSPYARHVKSVDISGHRIDDDGLRAILKSPYVEQWKSLRLSLNQITDEGAYLLAASDRIKHLQLLDVEGNPIRLRGMIALWCSPMIQGIEEVYDGAWELGDECFWVDHVDPEMSEEELLASATYRPAEVGVNPLYVMQRVQELAASEENEIYLHHKDSTPQGLSYLFEAIQRLENKRLVALDLSGYEHPLGGWLDSPVLGDVRELHLSERYVPVDEPLKGASQPEDKEFQRRGRGDEDIQFLSSFKRFKNLEVLSLCGVTDKGKALLAETPHLLELQQVDLGVA